MKILLLGYGKMGKIIDDLATKKGHTITSRISSDNVHQLDDLKTGDVDVAIEFSNPASALMNIKWCINHNIPVIVGTTGWLEGKEELDEYCISKNGTYLYASNFSIGVNLFFKLNEALARMMNSQPEYKTSISEIHHTQKLDAPSGTAITLADALIQNISGLSSWHKGHGNKEGSVGIKSERVDPTPGTHIIEHSSEVDTIEIKHTAHSRLGFASGALAVAEWIVDKKGILTFDDFLNQA